MYKERFKEPADNLVEHDHARYTSQEVTPGNFTDYVPENGLDSIPSLMGEKVVGMTFGGSLFVEAAGNRPDSVALASDGTNWRMKDYSEQENTAPLLLMSVKDGYEGEDYSFQE